MITQNGIDYEFLGYHWIPEATHYLDAEGLVEEITDGNRRVFNTVCLKVAARNFDINMVVDGGGSCTVTALTAEDAKHQVREALAVLGINDEDYYLRLNNIEEV